MERSNKKRNSSGVRRVKGDEAHYGRTEANKRPWGDAIARLCAVLTVQCYLFTWVMGLLQFFCRMMLVQSLRRSVPCSVGIDCADYRASIGQKHSKSNIALTIVNRNQTFQVSGYDGDR